jgi:hypothetical protein
MNSNLLTVTDICRKLGIQRQSFYARKTRGGVPDGYIVGTAGKAHLYKPEILNALRPRYAHEHTSIAVQNTQTDAKSVAIDLIKAGFEDAGLWLIKNNA